MDVYDHFGHASTLANLAELTNGIGGSVPTATRPVGSKRKIEHGKGVVQADLEKIKTVILFVGKCRFKE
jgi:hypothetical protein